MTEDRVAIVTAAGKGLGAAIARRLASDGYVLALMSSGGGAEALASELGGLGFTGSVAEPADLEAVVAGTMETHGRIDAVVNNTGHPPKGRLLDISDDEWYAGLDLLLLNVVRLARLVTPIMASQGGGAIVNISTFSAFEPESDFPVSSSLRAALGGFTKLYADAHASDGIRMNNVLPGFAESYDVTPENLERIPMGRAATVDEIASAAAFLLSSDAGYITGQNLRVDGGITRSV